MAGIGFELKKVFRGGGVFAVLRGYSLTAVVTEGPMVLMIVLLFTLQRLLADSGAAYRVREQFLFFMTYAMIFSLILADTVLLFFDRFISDCIYGRRLEDVLPAFCGLVFFLLLAGAPAAAIYLHTLPVSGSVRMAAGLLFCVLLILWVQMSCLSAVKRYGYLLLGFVAGTVTALVLAWAFLRGGMDPLAAALWGTALGFLVLLFLYMGQLLACYPAGSWNLLVFFPALQRYPGLLLTGLLLGLGLYGHNFVFWASDARVRVFPTGVCCARYDVPAFFATLTILPMLVQFVVGLETRFARRHRAYFDALRRPSGGHPRRQAGDGDRPLRRTGPHAAAAVHRGGGVGGVSGQFPPDGGPGRDDGRYLPAALLRLLPVRAGQVRHRGAALLRRPRRGLPGGGTLRGAERGSLPGDAGHRPRHLGCRVPGGGGGHRLLGTAAAAAVSGGAGIPCVLRAAPF